MQGIGRTSAVAFGKRRLDTPEEKMMARDPSMSLVVCPLTDMPSDKSSHASVKPFAGEYWSSPVNLVVSIPPSVSSAPPTLPGVKYKPNRAN